MIFEAQVNNRYFRGHLHEDSINHSACFCISTGDSPDLPIRRESSESEWKISGPTKRGLMVIVEAVLSGTLGLPACTCLLVSVLVVARFLREREGFELRSTEFELFNFLDFTVNVAT